LKAAKEGNAAAVRAAIRAGADPAAVDDAGNAALGLAAAGGHLEAVEALVQAGSDPRKGGGGGLTPLMQAARSGSVEVVRALLDAGAEVGAQDQRGRTALVHGVAAGSAVIQALLAAGADPAATDETGATALHRAAEDGSLAAVEILIAAHADVNASVPHDGSTPLMVAAAGGHTDVVRALLAAKADPRRVNGDGQTALDLAQAGGHADAVALLRPAGKPVPARQETKPAARTATRSAPPTPAAKAAPPKGDFAEGTLTVNGDTVKLTHAYLWPDTGTPAAVILSLTDVAVDPAQIKDTFSIRHLSDEGALRLVRIRITSEDKQAASAEVYDNRLRGGRTGVVVDSRLAASVFEPGLIEGKVSLAKPFEAPEGTFRYAASFRASAGGGRAPADAAASTPLADLPTGKARGRFTVDGKSITLAYAYAWVDQKDERKPVLVLVSDQAVSESALKNEFLLNDLAHSGRLRGICLYFDKDKEIFRGQLYHPAFEGTVSATGMHVFEPGSFDTRSVSGRMHTNREQSFSGHTWEYTADLNALINR
jgi:ankyrin repeat protein